MIENRPPKLNFFRGDYEALNSLIGRIDWANEFEHLDVDEATRRFYDVLMALFDGVPKVIVDKSKYPRWFSYELIGLIRSKQIAHSELRALEKRCWGQLDAHEQKHHSELKENFSSLRRSAKKLTDVCHCEYIADIEEKLSRNTKCFFSYTKSLKTSNSFPVNVQFGGDSSTDKQSACVCLLDISRQCTRNLIRK